MTVSQGQCLLSEASPLANRLSSCAVLVQEFIHLLEQRSPFLLCSSLKPFDCFAS